MVSIMYSESEAMEEACIDVSHANVVHVSIEKWPNWLPSFVLNVSSVEKRSTKVGLLYPLKSSLCIFLEFSYGCFRP